MLAEIAAINILRAALAYTETAYKAADDEPDDPESYVYLDNGEAFECLFDEEQVAIVPVIAKHKKFSRCELRSLYYPDTGWRSYRIRTFRANLLQLLGQEETWQG